MAVIEQDVVFTTKDANGNTVIQMPITRAENIENVMSIEQGGTGATTVAAARNALGLGNTSGAVPIANGGTGATTAASARTNLGLSTAVTAASISGKTITLTKADGTTTNLTTQDTAPFTARATAIGGASTTKPAVVVESYQSGTEWYRLWSDGWLEQGGQVGGSTSTGNNWTTYTVTFHKAFADTNYGLNGQGNSADRTTDLRITAKSTTNATVISVSVYPNVQRVIWIARGKAA